MNGAQDVKRHLSAVAQAAGDLAETTSSIRFMMARYSETGEPRVMACETRPVDTGAFRGEWFIPPEADEGCRALYLHGGGWVGGSVDTHRHLVDALAIATCRPILAIEYRLAPEHPFPAGLDDCCAALAWIREWGPSGPSKASHVAAMGDSAGGNLSCAATLHALGEGQAAPDALVLLSPVVDFRPAERQPKGIEDPVCTADSLPSLGSLYFQDAAAQSNPTISPLAADDAMFAGFPPTLIQLGSDEYLRDQGVLFAAALWDHQVPVHLSVWPNMPHVFQLFGRELRAAQRAVREIAEFLRDEDTARQVG